MIDKLGTIVARNCCECGHHEIGIMTEEGYIALRSGMLIRPGVWYVGIFNSEGHEIACLDERGEIDEE